MRNMRSQVLRCLSVVGGQGIGIGKRAYRAMVLEPSGKLVPRTFDVAEILAMPEMHARDLISMSLQEVGVEQEPEEEYKDAEIERDNAWMGSHVVEGRFNSMILDRPIPLILPRGHTILVAMGHIRAVIASNQCVFFDAHLPTVRLTIEEIAAIIKGERKMAFELAVLEAAVKTLCERYQRRARLFCSSVDFMLSAGEGEGASNPAESTKYQQLLAVRDGISSFTLKVDDMINAFVELLENDQDMADLALSEKATNADVESRHYQVELLFENYHRQLTLIHQQMVQLERRLKSRQELEAMTLDVYRNRLITLDVEMSMRSIGLGLCTVMAGFFGMNLHNGAEQFHPLAFYTICGGIGFSAFSYYSKMLRELNSMRASLSRKDDLFAWKGIFENMSAVERVIQNNMSSHEIIPVRQVENELRQLIGHEVSPREAQIVHTILSRERTHKS
jgi:magnesium transporter